MNNKNEELFLHLSREEFYQWLQKNGETATACYLSIKRSDPRKLKAGELSYLDAVEVALCFGWIDSCLQKKDGILYQRFSPRRPKSYWTELNKERCRRLIKLGEMTAAGLKVCPPLDEPFSEPPQIIKELQAHPEAYRFFRQTPPLYQRIRLYNINFYREQKKEKEYQAAIKKLIEQCAQKKLYGAWDDFGRLYQINK